MLLEKQKTTRLSTTLLICLASALTIFASCGSDDGPKTAAATPLYLTVSSHTPVNGALSVASNSSVSVAFGEALNPVTIIPSNFSIDGLAAGVVTHQQDSRIVTYTPIATLAAGTSYTFRVSTALRSLAGRTLQSAFTFSFTTGLAPDATPPMVVSTTPLTDATSVPLNTLLTAAFNESILPTSVTASSFTLVTGGNSVAATVAYSEAGRIATLTPTAALQPSTLYSATLATDIRDLAGNALASATLWSFMTGSLTDTIAPTVSAVNPKSGVSGVATNTAVNATFNEAMNPATMSTTSFTLTGPLSVLVPGTISHIDLSGIVTFTPTSALAANTQYTARVTTALRDLAGNPLAAAFQWSFTTAASADATPPAVTSAIPADLAIDVATNGILILTFSESMNPATINQSTFQLALTAGATLAGSVSYTDAGHAARFAPTSEFLPSTSYTATMTVGARDLRGNALVSPFVWSFTTAADGDVLAPTVVSTNPIDTGTNIAINRKVNATFSEAMDPASLTTASVLLQGPGTNAVAGTLAYNSLTSIVTFSPLVDLAANTLYTATITTSARDLAMNALATEYVWSFTTADGADLQPVSLGSAATFAVLTGSSIQNTDGTIINGDLGISPGSSLTGFPIGIVNGMIHTANPVSAAAMLDLTVAYNDAKGRSLNAISLPGNLGGLTLTPGLYSNSSTSGISGTGANAILTLDAQGDSTAVFIFQMGSTLITDSGTSIVLAGGADAANIFWQVSSSATLGTNSIFYGTIMADQSITLTTGATLTGRVLARIGSITLDANPITLP